MDVVKKRALDAMVTRKVQQALTKDRGLIQDMSYAGFLDRWQHENARRAEELTAKRPVYGPRHFGQDEYFAYEFSNSIVELEKSFSKSVNLTQEELLKDYQESRDQLFLRDVTSHVQIVSLFPYRRGSHS